MRFGDVMRIITPPVLGFQPQITSKYGQRDSRMHLGTDFAYSDAAIPFIPEHPPVYSPISGKIEDIDRDFWGQIRIRDYEGNLHIITHLDALNLNLKVGDYVRLGDPIGTMGGRGDSNNDGIFGPDEYKHHVDYKIKNSHGVG